MVINGHCWVLPKAEVNGRAVILLIFLWVVFNGISKAFHCHLILSSSSKTISNSQKTEKEQLVLVQYLCYYFCRITITKNIYILIAYNLQASSLLLLAKSSTPASTVFYKVNCQNMQLLVIGSNQQQTLWYAKHDRKHVNNKFTISTWNRFRYFYGLQQFIMTIRKRNDTEAWCCSHFTWQPR